MKEFEFGEIRSAAELAQIKQQQRKIPQTRMESGAKRILGKNHHHEVKIFFCCYRILFHFFSGRCPN